MELQTLKSTMGLILSEKETPGTLHSTTILTTELHTASYSKAFPASFSKPHTQFISFWRMC